MSRLDAVDFLEEVSRELPDGGREAVLHLQNLRCGACVRRIENSLDVDIEIDLPSSTALLRWQPNQQALSVVLKQLDEMGFPATTQHDDGRYDLALKLHRQALMRLGVALLFGMQVMMLASGEYFGHIDLEYQPLLRYAQWLLATPVAVYAGWPFLHAGLSSLFARQPSMDSPVALAMISAYGLSVWHTVTDSGAVYFDSVAMFVLLLSLARMAQNRGQLQSAERLRRLLASQVATALRETASGLETVATKDLLIGDTVVVGAGMTLPADGELLEAAELDESLLNGESLPSSRHIGETALAGSINLGDASLRICVTHCGADTQLTQIAQLAQRAQMQRPVLNGVTEWVARHFIGLVLLAAAVTLLIWASEPERAIEAVLAVLVVTCPCALSLAVPTTLAAAVTRLGRRGVLLVNPVSLLGSKDISDVCLDKTGTLTSGGLRIAEVRTVGGQTEQGCRQLAESLQAGLTHPVAQAFIGETQPPIPEGRQLLPGKGLKARVSGLEYSLVNCDIPDEADRSLRWFVLRDAAQQPLAWFGLTETLRSSVVTTTQQLQAQGLKLHLLSGDPSDTVVALGKRLGLEFMCRAQMPADKLQYMANLQQQGRKVMAVGDGINDGPVLAGADIAVGLASGSAMAQSAGDVILVNDQLDGLLALLETGKRADRIIRQNFAWAIVYNVTMVPIAMSGMVTPWLAALGMGASSLVVTLNSLRLLRESRTADNSFLPVEREL